MNIVDHQMAEVRPSDTEQSGTEDELGKTMVEGNDKQGSAVTAVEDKLPQISKASASKQVARSRKPKKRKR